MPQLAPATTRREIAETPDLRRVYDRHAPRVRALLRRLLGDSADPDDLLQDVFLIAWSKRRLLVEETAFSFLCAIAVKLAATARRRARIRRFLGLDAVRSLPDWRTPERLAEQGDARRMVYGILDSMSEKRRTVFVLHELEGMRGPEIAAVLNCPVGTVSTRLMHARRDFLARVEALWAELEARSGLPRQAPLQGRRHA